MFDSWLKNPFDPAYPVVENEMQFRRLYFIHKVRDVLKKSFRTLERLTDNRSSHLAEKPEVTRCKVGTAGRMWHVENMIFCDELFGDF
jgi:hypothetical protein